MCIQKQRLSSIGNNSVTLQDGDSYDSTVFGPSLTTHINNEVLSCWNYFTLPAADILEAAERVTESSLSMCVTVFCIGIHFSSPFHPCNCDKIIYFSKRARQKLNMLVTWSTRTITKGKMSILKQNSCNQNEGTYKRMAKGIYDLMFSSWSVKWLVFFFLLNRDFIRSREPWFSKIFLREMRKKCLIFRELWLWLCLVLFSTVINNIAWSWQDLVFLLGLHFTEQEADG